MNSYLTGVKRAEFEALDIPQEIKDREKVEIPCTLCKETMYLPRSTYEASLEMAEQAGIGDLIPMCEECYQSLGLPGETRSTIDVVDLRILDKVRKYRDEMN